MALDELRIARQMTQPRLAQALHKSQAAISKIERRADMYVSTLGMLEIRAVFPESAVVITQFEQIQEAQGGTEAEQQPMGTEPSNAG